MDCFECRKVSFSLASLSGYAFFLCFESCVPSGFLMGQLHGLAGLWVALQMVSAPVPGMVTS